MEDKIVKLLAQKDQEHEALEAKMELLQAKRAQLQEALDTAQTEVHERWKAMEEAEFGSSAGRTRDVRGRWRACMTDLVEEKYEISRLAPDIQRLIAGVRDTVLDQVCDVHERREDTRQYRKRVGLAEQTSPAETANPRTPKAARSRDHDSPPLTRCTLILIVGPRTTVPGQTRRMRGRPLRTRVRPSIASAAHGML